MRESDAAYFGQVFASHPEVTVSNARVAPVELETIDGLLLTGGADIAPEFHPVAQADTLWIRDPDPKRDAWEMDAARFAHERRLPMLCICKGMQVLNVALGGTLLPDIPGHDLPEMRDSNIQPLRYGKAARHRFEMVNSSHHQALDRVAAELEVEAWHAGDGIIEQVRIRDYPWGIGVQYHPERHPIYTPLFEDFLAQLPHRTD
jgi:putative glutamine amidotransferase